MKHSKTLRWLITLVIALLCAACGGGSNNTALTRVAVFAPAQLTIMKPITTCASLATVDLTDIGGVGSVITSATEGTGTINGASVKFCTVEGTLTPAVAFRVRLPIDSWTQRSLDLGCGGLCGNTSAAFEPVQAYGCPLSQSGGFVLASTNMGHAGSEPNWSQDAQRRVDFAYRGVHITSLASKKLIKAYYGQAQKYSYFVGCSDGGREGLMAAQRYPTDYNGVVVGAPAFMFNVQNSLLHGWEARSNRDTGLTTGTVVLYPAKAAVLHKAVVTACDALDGQTDGLLSDPRLCKFDPGTIQCGTGTTDTSACLTANEVIAARKIYNGPTDPTTGRRILVGTPQYGSELNWPGVFVPSNNAVTTHVNSDMFVDGARNLIFTETPPPVLDQFDFTEAFYAKLRPRHALIDATNPDLSAFQAAGGKLILWHGWADQHISPQGTIAYYEAMQKTMGQGNMDAFMRMYLVPGVGHCGSGEGNDSLDLVTPVVAWVEQSMQADVVTTYRVDTTTKAVTSSRPLFPYPAVAKYNGTGDPTAAVNYSRGTALYTAQVPDWAGSDMFKPYPPAPL